MKALSPAWIGIVLSLGCTTSPLLAAKRSPADEARATLRMAADCAAKNNVFFRYGVQLGAFLQTSPLDPALAKLNVTGLTFYDLNYGGRDSKFAWTVAIRDCMFERRPLGDNHVGSLSFSPMLLRGMLFRGLYLQQFGRQGPIAFKPLPDRSNWRPSPDHGFAPLQQFGECVAERDPETSRAILVAPAGSEDEQRVYARLASALSACVGPGSTIHFSKSVIEGLVAEGLFHLSGGNLTRIGSKS